MSVAILLAEEGLVERVGRCGGSHEARIRRDTMYGMAKVTAAATLIALAFAGPTGASAADGKKTTTESVKTTVSDSWITSKT
jgi:hypothetical protein